ncbi:putative T7SS-secreted protein [Streptomyces sp. Z26]|uniref:putative T7SS-secreted protein n=1 Tax=Streptomyces sp. Z26 TaxID=2500177 RepID=UPI000EF152C1|nr:RHS repeat-associated core domain-containing protein [Streptomyces sp. Z26]RLL66095.1 RHS repeat protein [Streptomyces sp. Z26]
MGFGDFVPDPLEDLAEKGAEKLGEGVDAASDWGADRLDDVGWESGADWVRDKGDSVANTLGADSDELQLGQTEDEKKLIHGSPSTLRSTASHLTDFKKAFTNVGNGLKGLDSAHLKGEAADAFREKVAVEPKKWFKAADACEKAAKALTDFAGTVSWAQGQAKEAVALYAKGKKASETHGAKVDAYNDAVDTYNAKPAGERDPDSLPDKPPGTDPGAADVKAAREKLADARRQRDEAAAPTRTALQAARDAAPDKPSYVEQAQDGMEGLNLSASHVLGGAVKGTAGVLNFVRSVNPTDPYNVTHPAEYLTSLNSTTAGLVRMTNDPLGTAKTMYDGFMKDPAEGAGRLIPELLGTRGLGTLKKGATAARTAARTEGRTALRKDGPEQHRNPPDKRPAGGTDPVDLSTGKMFLPQTDVVLPASLPLEFQRHAESGYRSGRWFGPTWISTADQRLEIDAEGVVFVAEDGRLLSYPHPAPGLPTLPAAGAARMPLERTRDGGYTLTDPDTGCVRHFAPPTGGGGSGDGDARIEEITDRNGARVTFEYTPDGTPLRLVHTGGYTLLLTTADGRITALSLVGAAPDGTDQVIRRYGYTDGDLTEVTGSSGPPLRFTYDDEHRVAAWTDTNGHRYDYVYDNLDRCVAEGGTDGHLQIRIDYGPTDPVTGHRTTTLTTAAGHTTRHLIDDRSHVVAVTDPLGHTEYTERDALQRPTVCTDRLGRGTSFAYDDAGRLSRVTRPDGRSTEVVRGPFGLPVEVRAVDGAVRRSTYDDRGNRTSTTDPAGHTTRYVYDARGHLRAVTDPLGGTTRVWCDAAGLPVEVTDPLGAVTRYDHDAFGRPVRIVDPTGGTTRLDWTVEGALARQIDPDGAEQTWEYDGEGNRVRHTDADGGVTTYEYGPFDVLVASTGPDGARHAFRHDAELRLTRVTNPQGLTWEYDYDPAGRLVSESDFDGRTQTYVHDAEGQVVARTGPLGDTVTFALDELGNIVRKTAGTDVTTYRYDAAGRVLDAIGPEAELRWQRDRSGRIKAELTDDRVLAYAYDALGRRTRRVSPTGAVSTFAYDAAGNETTVTTNGHTLDFRHDAAGRETARRIGGDGLTLSQRWDPAGQLIDQTLTRNGSRRLQQRTYTYRADGRLVGISDPDDGDRSFGLDGAGRVTSVDAADWTERYAYDDAGNQTHATWPTRHAEPYAAGPRTRTGTRITSAGRVRYEHDAAGRVVLRQRTRLSRKPDTWRYTWDAEDRLRSVTTPDGTVWRYRYDPLGRRIAKQRLGPDGETVVEQVDFTWDGPLLVEQTTTRPAAGPGARRPVTLTWDHHGFTALAQTERITDESTQAEIDSRFFAVITDLVGTPTELVDEQGDIAWRTRRTLWGSTTWASGSTAYTPLRFPGQYHDPETGLHYNLHRYYDPATAQYASPDPLGLAPGPNPSAYVPNPLFWIDPLGLTRQPVGWGGSHYSLRPSNWTDGSDTNSYERNHIPARDAYLGVGQGNLSYGAGPAIRMEYQDHRDFISTGSNLESRHWRRQQEDLIRQGQFDEAMKMDIDEIRREHGTKYDGAIKEMIDHMPHNKGFQKYLSDNGWKIRYCRLQ